jgi:hypothetical protein
MTDFNLARIKFNVVVENRFFLKNNQPYSMPVASEFLDISIPLFSDSSRINYFNHLHNNNLEPYKLKIGDIVVYTYSVHDIFDDLEYVLFSQKNDNKYLKRIVRLIFMFVLSSFIGSAQHNTAYGPETMSLINASSALYDYIANNTNYPDDTIINLLEYDHQTSSSNMKYFLESVNKNIIKWFT